MGNAPELANYVRQVRLAKGYTIAEMAVALGVHYQTVRSWESGKHTMSADKLIALDVLPKKLVVRKPRTGPRTKREDGGGQK